MAIFFLTFLINKCDKLKVPVSIVSRLLFDNDSLLQVFQKILYLERPLVCVSTFKNFIVIETEAQIYSLHAF